MIQLANISSLTMNLRICTVDNSVDSTLSSDIDVPCSSNVTTELILPDFRPLLLRDFTEISRVVDQQSDILSDCDDNVNDLDCSPKDNSVDDDDSDSDSSVISYQSFCDGNNNDVIHKPITSVI